MKKRILGQVRLFEFNLITIERKIKVKVAMLKPETARHSSWKLSNPRRTVVKPNPGLLRSA